MKIGIIGGGPAGMFAALEASKRFSNVTIFDNNGFLGRKLAATGAGRCNLTNINVKPNSYRSYENFEFGDIVQKYDYFFLQQYFEELGLFTYHTDDGWVYPLSNSAINTATFLEEILIKRGVLINLNIEVIDILHEKTQFILVSSSGKRLLFDRIILASGGKAYPQLNASDKILNSLIHFGHKLLPAFPALAPVLTSKDQTKLLNGVKCYAAIRIFNDNEVIGTEIGNIIFTDWGINGPGVMNLSHLIHKGSGNLQIQIDFIPVTPQLFFENSIKNEQELLKLETPFLSLLNKKIIYQLAINCDLNPQKPYSSSDFKKLMSHLYFTENVLGTRDFHFSQISTGAIKSLHINSESLESKLRPGLYFAGEILDVFGPCGGYNLHWAFISGIVAGRSIK
ncbi:MAG: aminoacetone oxidase family FAD-binding enzyme [Anaerolineaceae bacterium]|nr:aminoacetone oxidase family FAD-binding enzyme [Anaerolineaceae bacterium]